MAKYGQAASVASSSKTQSSDDDDDDDDDDSEAKDAGPSDIERLKMIFTTVGVPKELRKELAVALLAWKKGEELKPKKAEPTRKEREAAKAKEEDEEDEEPDPAVQKKLEEVRKRREAQAKQRIAADGWDRMKPVTADNHPPGQPPSGTAAEIS